MIVPVTNQVEFREFHQLFQKVLNNLSPKIYAPDIKKDLLQGYTYQYLLNLFHQKDSYFVTAKKDNRIVAFTFGWPEYNVFWLEWMGVDPNYRSKGIGTALFDHLTNYCKEKQYHKFVFNTISKNTRGLSLYKRIGFEVEAIFEKHWYNEDWVYLKKEIK